MIRSTMRRLLAALTFGGGFIVDGTGAPGCPGLTEAPAEIFGIPHRGRGKERKE
jgi:hypothetical protein